MKKNKKVLKIILFALLLLVSIVASLNIGSASSSMGKVINALFGDQLDGFSRILFTVRLPRVIVAVIAGANLAVAGALLQSVMQNPLADPSIVGVSSGASLAAIITMFIFPQLVSYIPILAFTGGLVAFFIVYILAWKDGVNPIRIILAGVAVNAILGGLTNVLGILNTEKIQGLIMWMSGSIGGKKWEDVRILLIYSIIGIILAILSIRKSNILLLGDEMAHNLGVDTIKARLQLSVIAVLLAATSTAYTGVIAFVGLIIPHIARMIVGSDYKYIIPASVFLGGMAVLWADTFARTAFAPLELPVGIFMSIVGGPFFLYLLRRSKA